VRTALAGAVQYRASFLLDATTGLGGAMAVVLPIAFVYGHAPSIAGWSRPEALLVTGFFLVLQGFVGVVLEPNFAALVDAIRRGTLDFVLLKPVDSQLVVSLQRLSPQRAWDVIAGVAVLATALHDLPTPGPGATLAAAGLFAAGALATYGLYLAVVCTSFWFVRVDNLRFLLAGVLDAGRWPLGVYRGWVRTLLTVVVPVVLVTSTPALALRGRIGPELVTQALLVATGMLIGSRWLWRVAVRRYGSAGG
jgi:ABC-2 type transport system permease protein